MSFDQFFYPNSLIPRLTPIACGICVVVFIGLFLGGKDMTWAQAAHWGYFPSLSVWLGKPYALITSVFVHFEIWHIAFNLYWLWLLGNLLEDEIGPLRFLAFFLVAAWVSSAFELLFDGDMGIGMSGVGYALFGFGWVARAKMRRFSLILNQQTVNVFFIWLVACFVLTYTGAMAIANFAHVSGLIFGAAVAYVFVEKRHLPFSALGLALFVAASFTPLFWCPTSKEWRELKAYRSLETRREIALHYRLT